MMPSKSSAGAKFTYPDNENREVWEALDYCMFRSRPCENPKYYTKYPGLCKLRQINDSTVAFCNAKRMSHPFGINLVHSFESLAYMVVNAHVRCLLSAHLSLIDGHIRGGLMIISSGATIVEVSKDALAPFFGKPEKFYNKCRDTLEAHALKIERMR